MTDRLLTDLLVAIASVDDAKARVDLEWCLDATADAVEGTAPAMRGPAAPTSGFFPRPGGEVGRSFAETPSYRSRTGSPLFVPLSNGTTEE